MSETRGDGNSGVSPTVADLSLLVAQPIRREILAELSHHERTVTDLAGRLDLSLAAVSYHLRKLYGAELVTFTQVKRTRVYDLGPCIDVQHGDGQEIVRCSTKTGECTIIEQSMRAQTNGRNEIIMPN